MVRHGWLLAGLVALGCGASNSLSGTGAFQVKSAEEYAGQLDGGAADWSNVIINLTDQSADPLCANTTTVPPALQIVAVAFSTGAGPVAPGTYTISGSSIALVLAETLTSSGLAGFGYSTSGSVTLNSVGPHGASGHFSVAMGYMDGGTGSLSGAFDGPFCKTISTFY